MISFYRFSSYIIIISGYYFTVEAKFKENALIFNPESKQLEELDQYITNSDINYCTVCLTACPAFSKKELLINENISITGKSVFLQAIYRDEFADDVKTNICDESYKPTMVQDTWTESYETGYELFYREGNIKLRFGKYNYLSKVTNRKPTATSIFSENFSLRKIDDGDNTKFKIYFHKSHLNLVFFWIPVLSIRVSGTYRQIYFSKDVINNYYQQHPTISMCKDYNLDESQEIPSQSWLKLEKSINGNGNDEDYPLEEMQIIPMSYFHTHSARLATCTYLNVVYIWKSLTMDQYKKVDLYLYSLYRLWPNNVNIIFGAKGVSNDISPDQLDKINAPYSKLIPAEFQIPVSDILYRIVEYNTNYTDSAVIIVIHNVLGSVPDEERICDSQFQVTAGWNDIKTEQAQNEEYDQSIEITYACPITAEIVEKLQINYAVISRRKEFTLSKDDRDKIKMVMGFVANSHNDGHDIR